VQTKEMKLREDREGVARLRMVAAWELKHGSPRIAAQIDVLADWREKDLARRALPWYHPGRWGFDPSAKALYQRLDWKGIREAMARGGERERTAFGAAKATPVDPSRLLS